MVESGVMLRIIMFAAGVVLFIASVSSLARRKMTESFCLAWGGISLIIIIAGIILRPDEWSRYISGTGMILLLMVAFCVVYGAYFMSHKVSELMRKNLELAMQVTLLNQENEQIKNQMEKLQRNMSRNTNNNKNHNKNYKYRKTERHIREEKQ